MQPAALTLLDPIIRTIITFLTVLIIARTLGKKQLSQLSLFDYIAGTALGSLCAAAMLNSSIPLFNAILCFITWTLLIMSVHALTTQSVPARKLLDELPRVVIRNGKILEQTLLNSQYTISDLLMQLRAKDVFDPAEIDLGIIETNGELSILKKPEYQNVIAKDLHIGNPTKNVAAFKYTGKELIIKGAIIPEHLSEMGISQNWLDEQLKGQGISNVKNVTVATLNPNGKLYIDLEFDLKENTVE